MTAVSDETGRVDAAAKYLCETVDRCAWNSKRTDGRARDAGFEPWHSSSTSILNNGNARQEDYRDVVRQIAALSAAPASDAVATVTYTNWRGETSVRRIIPKSVRYGSTEWHPEPQWLLLAWDDDKKSDREFALKDFGPSPPVEGLREALVEALHGLKYIEPAIPVLRTMFITADLKLGARKAEEMDASNKAVIVKLDAVLAALASPSLTAGEPLATDMDGCDCAACQAIDEQLGIKPAPATLIEQSGSEKT